MNKKKARRIDILMIRTQLNVTQEAINSATPLVPSELLEEIIDIQLQFTIMLEQKSIFFLVNASFCMYESINCLYEIAFGLHKPIGPKLRTTN